MGPLDLLTAPLRALLGVTENTERDVVSRSPLHATRELEEELDHAVASIHRAADSMERHVAVLETLTTSVPVLSDSVNALVNELNQLRGVLAPLAAAERDISGLGHLFGRRQATRVAAGAPSEAPKLPETPQAPSDS